MAQRLLASDTPMEFFRARLTEAMENQRVSASAFTEFYLVNLLTTCVRREVLPGPEPGYTETPLAVLYGRALQGPREERTRRLRELGDTALFVSGYFPDSHLGHAVDHSYYRDLGGRAYAHLSQEERLAHGPSVFAELSRRFSQFADLLSEVSDSTLAAGHLTLVKLYERWRATGSRRAAALLARRGLAPAPEPTPGVRH
jgi:hypothetical protein